MDQIFAVRQLCEKYLGVNKEEFYGLGEGV